MHILLLLLYLQLFSFYAQMSSPFNTTIKKGYGQQSRFIAIFPRNVENVFVNNSVYNPTRSRKLQYKRLLLHYSGYVWFFLSLIREILSLFGRKISKCENGSTVFYCLGKKNHFAREIQLFKICENVVNRLKRYSHFRSWKILKRGRLFLLAIVLSLI